MRDRLIDLLNIHQDYGTKHFHADGMQEVSSMSNELIADHLLANGVIVLPCKLGDTIYDISEFVNCVPCPEMYEDKVGFITIMNRNNGEMYFDIECVECDYDDFGKTIFFTKEEAEQALSKLQASYEQVKEGVQE